jgi:hypothetical protein
MSELPYYIQRLRASRSPGSKGVDGYFECDYMGSAEFEFGALPGSLRVMRSQHPETWKPTKMEVGNHVAWYVGPETLLPVATMVFTWELEGRPLRLKEPTHIASSYGTDPWYNDTSRILHPPKFAGWWAIDKGFAFFKTKNDAKSWLKGLLDV